MPLQVAIDAHNLSLREGTGIATYTRTLERALLAMGAGVHMVFGMAAPRGGCPPEVGFFDAFRAPPPRRRLLHLAGLGASLVRHAAGPLRAARVPTQGIVDRRQLERRLPHAATLYNAPGLYELASARFRLTGRLLPVAIDEPIDVFHTTCPMAVTMEGVARVCTIHDLVPLTLPFTTVDRKPDYWKLLRRIASDFDLLFAVSETTRQEVVRLLGVDERRIHVTYQGIDVDAEVVSESEEDLERLLGNAFGLPLCGYLLFAGAIEPKKNLNRLLEAYRASGVTLPLVVAGPDGWLMDEELRLWSSGGLGERPVVRVTYPARPLLLRLMRGARALVCPSLGEGFGLPAAEAMALGCPVMASRAGALPEICGEAAVFVDPYDVASIAEGLRAVARDADLCARLAAAGPVRAARFAMPEYRRRLAAGYEAALHATGRPPCPS